MISFFCVWTNQLIEIYLLIRQIYDKKGFLNVVTAVEFQAAESFLKRLIRKTDI